MSVEARREKRKTILLEELNRLVDAAVEMGAEKVILFGSLARGDIGSASDIDLVIIKETDKKFLDRLDEFYTKTQPRVAVDVLIYTPEEIKMLDKTRRFVRRILTEGVVKFEKAHNGRGSEVVESSTERPQ